MKIFFAGTLPSFEKRKNDYLEIRQTILDSGFTIARDWVKEEIEGKIKTTWHERWELVQQALSQADACILDCTLMDVFVGEQLAMIVERGMPLLLLIDGSQENTQDSPLTEYFISKDHLKYIKKEKYTKETLRQIVADFLEWVKENKRIVRFNLEIGKDLDDYLKDKANKNNSSKSEEIRKLIVENMETN